MGKNRDDVDKPNDDVNDSDDVDKPEDGSKPDDVDGDGSDGSDDSDDFDKDRALSTIRKQRAEEKRLRAKVKEYEDKDKTEAQKAKDDLKEVRRELAEARAEAKSEKIKSKATGMQMHNPDRAPALIDLDEHDGDADAALTALKKSDPYLFKSDSDSDDKPDPKDNADSGSAANKRRGYSKTLTLEQVKNMTPEELDKRAPEVDKFLASM